MPKIYGKGHQILAFFNIDYHVPLEPITDELMNNPDKRFRLSVERAPLKKKKKVK